MRIAIALAATASVLATAAAAQGVSLDTRLTADGRRVLVTGNGLAVYTFSADTSGDSPASACTGACAVTFPPLTAVNTSAQGSADGGKITSFTRKDGGPQVAYGGQPLYTFVGDRGGNRNAGDGLDQYGGTFHLATVDAPDAPGDSLTGLFDNAGFKSPECVRWDADNDRYLVSNLNGGMTEADDNGFISALGTNGMVDLKWIEAGKNDVTLHAPKGMEIAGGRLYVADVGALRVFDLADGKPVTSVAIDGADFLNDVAVTADGTVFATDTGTDDSPGAVYRISADGNVTKIASGEDLHRPNGIALDPSGNIVFVTYGGDEIVMMSPDGKVLDRRTLDVRKLDGLVLDGGTALVSSWDDHSIVAVDGDGPGKRIATGLTSPACFEVDRQHHLLLVPEVNADTVAVLPFEGDVASGGGN